MRFRLSPQRLLLTAAQAAVTALMLPSMASAATPDPFFQYSGATPLADIAPGTVLKSRNISVYIAGIKTTLQATQLVYRSTDAKQRPTANVTTGSGTMVAVAQPIPIPTTAPGSRIAKTRRLNSCRYA